MKNKNRISRLLVTLFCLTIIFCVNAFATNANALDIDQAHTETEAENMNEAEFPVYEVVEEWDGDIPLASEMVEICDYIGLSIIVPEKSAETQDCQESYVRCYLWNYLTRESKFTPIFDKAVCYFVTQDVKRYKELGEESGKTAVEYFNDLLGFSFPDEETMINQYIYPIIRTGFKKNTVINAVAEKEGFDMDDPSYDYMEDVFQMLMASAVIEVER